MCIDVKEDSLTPYKLIVCEKAKDGVSFMHDEDLIVN